MTKEELTQEINEINNLSNKLAMHWVAVGNELGAANANRYKDRERYKAIKRKLAALNSARLSLEVCASILQQNIK